MGERPANISKLVKSKEKFSHTMLRETLFKQIRKGARRAFLNKRERSRDEGMRFIATRLAKAEEKETRDPTTDTKHDTGSVPNHAGWRPSQAGQRHGKPKVAIEEVHAETWPTRQKADASPQPPPYPKKYGKAFPSKLKTSENKRYWKFWKTRK